MLSQSNSYKAAMYTFDCGRFKGTFLQNHFSEKVLPMSTLGLDKGCIFQDQRGRKIAQTYGNGDEFFGAILSSETDLVFMVTCFFLQAPGREW